ncbi:glycosyltransferase family 9 protein [Vibrio maritimus]|uniref:glycosyltransferase family 9 protein n=1 Tax=Vibrio maritimus TaxID=990268 RepID=UPI003734C67E
MKILVIRAGALGDTIFATAVIDCLRKHFGEDTRIDWLGNPLAKGLFAKDHRINTVFTIKSRKLATLFNVPKLKMLAHAQKAPYDLVVNLENSKSFRRFVNYIAARKAIHIGDVEIDTSEVHAVEHMLASLALAGIEDTNGFPRLIGDELSHVKAKFNLPERYVVFHPANSHSDKTDYRSYRSWPLPHWRSLIELTTKEIQVVLVGTDEEKAYLSEFLNGLGTDVIDLLGKSNLPELIAVLQGAKAVVTTDTGPSHMAAAAGAPTVALFGPSDPKGTAPYSCKFNTVHIASINIECSPCSHTERFKTCKNNRCMKQLHPEMVLDIISPYISQSSH